jgi:AcrR family transcriptional regulator
MDTRVTLLTAALKVLEDKGKAQFSTRAVCALANITAPTLYQH